MERLLKCNIILMQLCIDILKFHVTYEAVWRNTIMRAFFKEEQILQELQWEYCHADIGSSDDSSWTCKITYFSPQGVAFKELPSLKKNRADSFNPYYKIIGVLGLHGWEATSFSTSPPKNMTASGYFKRLITPGRRIDDLQIFL